MRTFIVSIFFIVSGILGFFCQMLYANYFGSGKEMDIYFSLLSIPAIVTGAAGTIFSSLFFPAFARIGEQELNDYIHKMKIYVSRIALVVSVIGFAITYINLTSIIDTTETSYYQLALILCALFWFNSYISIVNGYLASVQNFFKNFLVVSSTQLLVYVCSILFVVLFHDALGVRSIAAGLITASIASLAINRYYGGIFHKVSKNIKIDVLPLLVNICLIIISFLPFHAFASIAYMWAGQLENVGSVALLGYSHSFCGFLSTAASMGIATVSFPDLAKSLSSSNMQVLRKGFMNFRDQLEVVIVFASYVAIFASFFAHPIIEVLFMRGQFDLHSVNGLSSVLPIYLVNGVFIAMMNLTRNVFYSLNKQRIFAIFSGLVTVLFVLSSLLLAASVNYIIIGIVETASMGAFVLLSLSYANSLGKMFSYGYICRNIIQLSVLVVIAFLLFLLYQNIPIFNHNKITSILIFGIAYSLLVDVVLSIFIKNPIMVTVNKRIGAVLCNITRKCSSVVKF